jgi:hypothetical protein
MPSVRNWRGVGERTRVTLGQRSRGRRYEPSSHAADKPGVLLRQVGESERLLDNLDLPLVVLAGHVRSVLGSEYLLEGTHS